MVKAAEKNEQGDDEVAADTTRNLYQRINAVMDEVGKLAKTGKNTTQNYTFIEQAVLMAKLRPLFVKHGVVLLPAIVSTNYRQPDGARMVTACCSMSFTLINADNPSERESCPWFSEGADMGDKAVNKAGTSGEKYFLMKLLMLSDKDDPDAESPGHDEPANNRQQAPRQQYQSKPRTSEQAPAAKPASNVGWDDEPGTLDERVDQAAKERIAKATAQDAPASFVPVTENQLAVLSKLLTSLGQTKEFQAIKPTQLDTRDAAEWIDNLQSEIKIAGQAAGKTSTGPRTNPNAPEAPDVPDDAPAPQSWIDGLNKTATTLLQLTGEKLPLVVTMTAGEARKMKPELVAKIKYAREQKAIGTP